MIKWPGLYMPPINLWNVPRVESEMSLTAKKAMERMCALQALAAEHVGYEYAADCFCGDGGFWKAEGYDGTFEGGYRNDGAAIEFIEAAVAEKIERDIADRRAKA